MRKRIRYFDLEKIANDNEALSEPEIEVKKNLAYDPRESLYARLDIEEALRILSKKQRECFKLVVLEGYTEREAAERLSISNNSVHVYIKRAKEKLKKFLKGVKQTP